MEDYLSIQFHLHSIFARLRSGSKTELDDSLPLTVVEDLHDESELGKSQQLEKGSNRL